MLGGPDIHPSMKSQSWDFLFCVGYHHGRGRPHPYEVYRYFSILLDSVHPNICTHKLLFTNYDKDLGSEPIKFPILLLYRL